MEVPDLELIQLCTPRGFPFPVLAVGWIETLPAKPHKAPNGTLPKLMEAWLAGQYIPSPCKGWHPCTMCPKHRKPGDLVKYKENRFYIEGGGHFLVSYKGLAYAAPVLLPHYIQTHDYHPPMQFIEALVQGQFHALQNSKSRAPAHAMKSL